MSAMFASNKFPPSQAFGFVARVHWRRAVHGPTARSAATAAASGTGRSFLGTTAGTALFAFSSSLLTWPLADLYLGPKLVMWGMKADPSQTANLLASSVALNVAQDTSLSQDACVVVVSGVPGAGKQLEHIAAHSERLVVYVSLREAASPHDLYFAMLAGIYSADRLGFVGTFAHSMGVWWIILFDIMVGCEPDKTRAINFSVILQHLRRALRAAHAEQPLNAPRPLVILDHIGEATHSKDDPIMCSMLTHLVKWCAATTYDDGLSDIVICDEARQALWMRLCSNGKAQKLANSQAFKDCLRIRWSL
eukprot:gnl/MRDRNA2_/MRDRNA2_130576_c0_seq1.p1 gnl/MRDRNA2_/MRDRNA2_130576_c0~~gnl/MRDRNA2_/MRDRNA2_130576_c0_seq1.p1  ORF type:complete len:307 (-),score=50.28 gnl/MRDRNA2_/MRDRNA2_130576_c0_seq1:99-1019(-)